MYFIFCTEYGYISSLDSILSDDNSTVTFTCHLACQTDFITGCNVTLVDACGKDFTQSCTVTNIQTFSPRQCSVVFSGFPPSSYDYTTTVESNIPLQLEENILSIIGTLNFGTAGKSPIYHAATMHSYH